PSTVAETTATTAPGSVPPAMNQAALLPAASTRHNVWSRSLDGRRALIITLAPPAATAQAIARPMLRAAPVIKTTLPLNSRFVMSSSLFVGQRGKGSDYRRTSLLPDRGNSSSAGAKQGK